jgi:hypothetical protein
VVVAQTGLSMRENASRRVANEWELRGVERCPPIDPLADMAPAPGIPGRPTAIRTG